MNREKFLEQKLKELTNLLFLYEVRHRAQGHLLSSEIYQFAEFYLTCAPNPSRPKVGLIGNKIAEFMVPFGIPCAYALSQFCIILKKKKKIIHNFRYAPKHDIHVWRKTLPGDMSLEKFKRELFLKFK